MDSSKYNNIDTEDGLLEGECTNNIAEPDTVYPDAEVRVEKTQYSTTHLKRLVENRKELIVTPDFQRNNVWKESQNVELVESILMGIPIPIIYLFETKSGKKQVVDGRQRINAILKFLNDKLVLKDLKILPQCNGKRFSDLDPKMQGIFEDYQLLFYIIQPPTPERVKYDIFDRVNRGGTRLTNQEMRNALYIGKTTKLLQELAETECFLDATGKGISNKRKKDQYVILRSLAFYLLKNRNSLLVEENGEPITYKSDIDDFLAKIMVFLNERASDELLNECREVFLRSMSNCYGVMGGDAFRFQSGTDKRRPINMQLFEVMMYIFSDVRIENNAERIRVQVEDFKRKVDHKQMFMGNVDSTVNLDERYRIADELLYFLVHL